MRKNKQISCTVIVQLIRASVFSLQIVPSLFFLNTKFLSVFCGCAAWFVPGLVGNLKTGAGRKPKDRFPRNVAYFIYIEKNKTLISCLHSQSATVFSYAKILNKQIFSRHGSFVILK